MKITRTVHGFVSQVYDTEKKCWVDQEFVAGDEEWESDGEVSEDEELEDMPEVEPPQMLMVQPAPPKKCVRVEYDMDYWGGDYSKVGQFAYVPFEVIDRLPATIRTGS